jgi:hypothetical protein
VYHILVLCLFNNEIVSFSSTWVDGIPGLKGNFILNHISPTFSRVNTFSQVAASD